MRMMMKVSMPVGPGNKAIKDGVLPKTIMEFVERTRPESTWFTSQHGQRTAFFVFDMKDPTMIPSLCEPFFMNLEAGIDISPVMNLEDLKAGLEKIKRT